ncbi:MAG: molybdate ABC transporter permease subunit [Dehalococcoidia bacterium]|nr:molybdate ABC transporter permease subunit [Dehalococcoidia bacterium]
MNTSLWTPIWISIKTVCTATVITFFLGIAAAHWMSRYKGKLKAVIDGIFILPMVMPPTVVGYWLLTFFGINGLGGKFFALFNYKLVFTWQATVVAAVIMSFPLMYMTAKGAFEQVEPNLQSAARTLGAGEWRIFWTVTLPLAWPGVAAATVLALARTLGEFGTTLMLAGNIRTKTTTIPVDIYFSIISGDNHRAQVLALVVMGFSFVALALVGFWKNRSNRTKGLMTTDG